MEEEQNSTEWSAPPPPEKIDAAEPAQMSEVATLGNIFLEPGKTFEDLKRKPRFILAGLIVIIAVSIFQVAYIQKIGFERIVRARMEASPRVADLPSDQKEKLIAQQSGPVMKGVSYGVLPIGLVIVFFVGGLLYWGGAKAMGGSGGYLSAVSVWVYSSLPPTLLFLIANLIVLLLKSVDEIDLNQSQGGVVHANPAMFIDAKAMPAVAAALSAFDLFSIIGWILAAIGLQKVAKLSSGSAWTIVLTFGIVGVLAKVIWVLLFGG